MATEPVDTRFPRVTEPSPPVTWREVLSLVALVACADVTIYRGQGFSGYALLFALAPLLLLIGVPQRRRIGGCVLVMLLSLLVAARLVWMGSWGAVACGFVLLLAQAVCLAGYPPFVFEIVAMASHVAVAGLTNSRHYATWGRQATPGVMRMPWINVVMPLLVCLSFSVIFLMANPDLVTAFGNNMSRIMENLRNLLIDFAPRWTEVLFWLAAACAGVGLLRPLDLPQISEAPATTSDKPAESLYFAAVRNTLWAVSGLFAVYLVFEFATLWFREFPPGFHYSGYAHQGAAWLTAALALATVLLSLFFRGDLLRDPRLNALKRVAWLWSSLNLLLAVAVYHRLSIYIGFNGMTRLRIVGLFGITTVVLGFALVIIKIARHKSFYWLVRRQLAALALACFLLVLLPMDSLVVPYNVRRILAGHLAPSVQFSVQPLALDGIPHLLPLVDCPDSIIRDGILAMLAEADEKARRRDARRPYENWTAYQGVERSVALALASSRPHWQAFEHPVTRSQALTRFHEYVYQWF